MKDQQWTATSFIRGTMIASLLLIALPGIVGKFVTDQIGAEPHREPVEINSFPWTSVGKINVAGIGTINFCTGAVIGPNQFLTAAHCLYNQRSRRFHSPDSIHFLLGFNRGQYLAHRVGSRYTMLPTFDYSKIETAGDDWAVVYIDEPFPSDVRPLKLATEVPMPGTAVKVGGYPRERSQIMTADKHCHVRAVSLDRKLIGHDCVIHHGDSGGPLLSGVEGAEGLILGVNSLGYSSAVEFQDQSKEGGIAAAAANISDFLGAQVIGRNF